MPRFAAGVIRFQTNIFPDKQDLFEELSQGQSPEALFITCADSRIETGLITQSEPGQLFSCRNAGNIVPPHTEHTGGMTASIEYAVAVLNVPHIVICGHTECGAMKGAMDMDGLTGLPHVRKWLGYSQAAVDIVNEIAPDASDDERMRMLIEQNVLIQLQHLKTHPSVAKRLAKGDLELHGWVYDIKTGAVDAYDDAENTFVHVDARYAEQIAKLASEHECAA
ncbi:carbonic anhydrase [Hyphomonas pacifica]|uniref:Carbonic anhydrase n=1 Tax=Hyphomonas pacifica TaxID=1280941 RepID=A0A062U874_9PROT|nr:carbonic anhydrase [Hyphomonas pacifica]KCZ52350.1 hypothetical protein HY2_09060 [Hyphomonas pacifica]RAN34756.1 hypothetical protein HY3_09665 [Hyphomonas pacifica]RAN36359.1 hypothetical protein HY11_01165 [Hyphomonas pacifica]